jgi:linoleate 9S-lipoxygenase
MPVPGSDAYKELEKNPEKFFVRSITTQSQAVVGISLLEILSSHSSHEVYLGLLADAG